MTGGSRQRSKDVLQIVIPEKMSYREAAKWLDRKDKEDETVSKKL